MDVLYTIKVRYVEKYKCDIYLVRLCSKTDRITLNNFIEGAKNCGGYYSTSIGGSGFLFQECEDAMVFGILIEYIYELNQLENYIERIMVNKNDFYTITEQYHEKKGTYIYVVRLIKKVSKDEFSNLRQYAKDYDGYYSTYRGVNGFVFQTEEDAESFASVLDSYLEIPDDRQTYEDSTVSEVEFPKKRKQKRSRIQSAQDADELVPEPIKISSGMSLHEALRNIIQSEGNDIITELRLVNILDDFHAYDSIPASKYILRAIIADGYAKKILALCKCDNSLQTLATKFASTTGFIPENVIRIFKSLAFGLGWIHKWDEKSISTNTIEQYLSSNNVTPSTAKSSYSKWSDKMDEEQTEQFFLSIVEYDKSEETKYKVRVENLQFYVDEDEDLHISCDLRRKHKKGYTVTLYYALYDLRGRLKYAPTNLCLGYTGPSDPTVKPLLVYFNEMKATEIGKIRLYLHSPDYSYY